MLTHIHTHIHTYMQLVPMPNDAFKLHTWMLMVFDLTGSLLVELFASLFLYNKACSGTTDRLLR